VSVARRATVAFVALAAADTLLAATGHDRRRWLTVKEDLTGIRLEQPAKY